MTGAMSNANAGHDSYSFAQETPFSGVLGTRRAQGTIPRPVGDGQTVRHIIGGVVVSGHRGGGCPREVVVQHLSDLLVVSKADVGQRLIETGDRPMVHLLMRTIAAVDPHHRGLVAVSNRVGGRPPKCLGPVGGEPLGVLGVKAVAERVAHHLVRHDVGVPGVGQTKQAKVTTCGFVHRLHALRIVSKSRNGHCHLLAKGKKRGSFGRFAACHVFENPRPNEASPPEADDLASARPHWHTRKGGIVQIVPKQPSVKGPPEWFTGDVFIDPIARGQEPSRIQVSAVHFTPGARSAWHSHGLGQTLYVTEGVGLIQSRGEEIHEIRSGDIIYAPSGEEHWHGGAPDHFMTHLSMTENAPDQPDHWGDHVTDAEYRGEQE
jgi:quercetin dioxygenase-like cupin family protein